ncbi:hypothetical protein BDM02DRAFT_3161031 [Thelephora ganbajun]|uniref:Uncharacterized protein n=1 Tax=Thelephora ganbajun TaxID=370292 RepID=A0ACB6ZRX9_THEGA|nr:hypothetical protein BDM02DRAFT_3161031 [Thelephora ganbajun]
MASIHHPPNVERHTQGSGIGRRRSSASSASRQVYPGEERHSWYEKHLGNNSSRTRRDTDLMYQEPKRHPLSRDPATPPKPNPDAQALRRSPTRNPSELTYSVQAPSFLDYPSQSQKEQKQRSISTPPAARRFHTDPVQNAKKRESGSLLPRTRSSLFLPTNARASRPTSSDGLEAFGLPPSLSYVFRDTTGSAGIAPAESGKSLDDRTESWKRDSDVRKNSEGLSSGAERLFQTLADEDTSRGSNSSRSPYRFSQTSYDTPTQVRRASLPAVRSDFSIASIPSAPSVYDDQAEEYEMNKKRHHQEPANTQSSASNALSSWRSTVSPSVYNSLTRLYGEAEMQRQEVIFEICHTEALFVQRLRTVLRLFIRPLRAQDTSTWISGVPGSIARLFDWFEDIINLHVEINTELRHVRSDHQTVVERFAGILRKFVPRFEVYQPYIIRVEGALERLKGEGSDDMDENWVNFREFVGIQGHEEDCEGRTLQNLLLEPIHRLEKYKEMFQTLLERTAKQHVDRLPTVSLVSSMKTTLRVMQEVKSREGEYKLIKDLASAIEGLTSPSSLAKRERQLLIRGSCRLLASRSQARSQRNSNGNRQSVVLLDAINNWDNTKRSERRRSLLPASSPDVDPSTFASSASSNKTTSGGSGSGYDLKFSPVEVFVFSDVVVVVTPAGKDRWKLVEKLGTARILGVAESTVIVQGHEEHVAELELVPVGDLQLEESHIDEDNLMSTPVSSIRISVDLEHQGDADRQERRKKWFASLRECCRATTLSLEFPLRFDLHQSLAGFGGMENFDGDKYKKVMDAGLPPPKSPSMQVQAYSRRQRRRSDFAQAEREERDWWSFRFKQVYLEMKRDER